MLYIFVLSAMSVECICLMTTHVLQFYYINAVYFYIVNYKCGLHLFNDDTCPSGHISRPTQVDVSHSCSNSLNRLVNQAWLYWTICHTLIDLWIFFMMPGQIFSCPSIWAQQTWRISYVSLPMTMVSYAWFYWKKYDCTWGTEFHSRS